MGPQHHVYVCPTLVPSHPLPVTAAWFNIPPNIDHLSCPLVPRPIVAAWLHTPSRLDHVSCPLYLPLRWQHGCKNHSQACQPLVPSKPSPTPNATQTSEHPSCPLPPTVAAWLETPRIGLAASRVPSPDRGAVLSLRQLTPLHSGRPSFLARPRWSPAPPRSCAINRTDIPGVAILRGFTRGGNVRARRRDNAGFMPPPLSDEGGTAASASSPGEESRKGRRDDSSVT